MEYIPSTVAFSYIALVCWCVHQYITSQPAGTRLKGLPHNSRQLLSLLLAGLVLALLQLLAPSYQLMQGKDASTCLGISSSPGSQAASDTPSAPWRRGAISLPAHVDNPTHFLHLSSLERLKAFGFKPDAILDVGANEGVWSRGAWHVWGSGEGGTTPPQMLMVEGSELHTAALEATGFHFVVSVVGASPRTVDFFSSDRAHTGNSVFRENTKHFDEFLPTKIPMRTLDQLLAGFSSNGGILPRPKLLKLDVQGYELEVLKGAENMLASVEVLVLETSIVQWNQGAPLMAEVLGALNCLGFQVLDVLDTPRLDGQAIQADLLLVRKGSNLIERASKVVGVKA